VGLIVVDVQEGFVTPETRATVPRIEDHLRRRRGDLAAVIATRFVNLPGSLYETQRDWHEMMDGPSTQVLPRIRQDADVVLVKHGLAPDRDELMESLRRLEFVFV
jgi:nicotinamidase-related amidase